jgi:hypothetical protein
MSIARLTEELEKIKPILNGAKVRIWITSNAERIIRARTDEELLAVIIDAYAKSARELGRSSEPFLMGHYENPDLRFVGTRLNPREPYFFVVQAADGDANWLRLMTDAFAEARTTT